MTNRPQAVKIREIINANNILVAKLQGKVQEHVGGIPTNDSIILVTILNKVKRKENLERYGLE
jgi:hypothetical protein